MKLRFRSKKAGPAARLLEAGLWLVALTIGVFACVLSFQVAGAQRRAAILRPATTPLAAGQDQAGQGKAEQDQAEQDKSESPAKAGTVIGRMQIAVLGLSVPMLESYDPATLTRGVGHVPGTANPGGLGNLVLAGHRDTFFRPLRRVQPGMQIEVTTAAGRWEYMIDRTEIVTPDRVDMLDIADRPEMTLITCYPFEFIGAAPKRFIVHAHLLSADSQ